MMFAGRCGAEISLDNLAKADSEVLDTLFNEELGAVFQIRKQDERRFNRCFATCGPPPGLIKTIGYVRPTPKQSLLIKFKTQTIIDIERSQLQQWWSSTSYEMQKLRDNTACAQSEFDTISDSQDPGMYYKLKFDPADISLPAMISLKGMISRPRGKQQDILRAKGRFINNFQSLSSESRVSTVTQKWPLRSVLLALMLLMCTCQISLMDFHWMVSVDWQPAVAFLMGK
jgi:hypothetical protein